MPVEMKPPRGGVEQDHGVSLWLKVAWMYCASCGAKNMWQLSDAGEDYYHDCSATCHSCGYVACCVEKIYVGA